jgi:hypothetical protein
MARSPRQHVFLNVPFDSQYRTLFTALIAGLTGLGCEPHCVLEISSSGRDRLDRIYELITDCGASIHDLSRVTLSGPLRVPRFNMPFELGLAYSLAQHQSHHQPHRFFVFEARQYRLQASLSDLNGHDPHIHRGTQQGLLRCLLDIFGTTTQAPSLAMLRSLSRKLSQVILRLQLDQGVEVPFHPYIFRQAVKAAAELAKAAGLIR